jgi:hypothetical protein
MRSVAMSSITTRTRHGEAHTYQHLQYCIEASLTVVVWRRKGNPGCEMPRSSEEQRGQDVIKQYISQPEAKCLAAHAHLGLNHM